MSLIRQAYLISKEELSSRKQSRNNCPVLSCRHVDGHVLTMKVDEGSIAEEDVRNFLLFYEDLESFCA